MIAHALNGYQTDDPAEILRVLSARFQARFAAENDPGTEAPSSDLGADAALAADLGSAEHVIAGWPGRT